MNTLPQSQMTLAQAIQLALQHHQEGNLDVAAGLYQRILEVEPTQVDVLHWLGVVRDQQGNAAEAVTLIKQSLQIKEANPEAHNNLGIALQTLGNEEIAFTHFKRAVELDPSYAEAEYNLGQIYSSRHDIEHAALHLQKAIKVNPNYVDAWFLLAQVLKDQGDQQGSLNCYERAISLRVPQQAEAHIKRGKQLAAGGKPELAELEYVSAMLLCEQNNPKSHFQTAVVLRKFPDKQDDAIRHFLKAIELKPDYAEALNDLGLLYKSRCEWDKALYYLSKAVACKPFYQAEFNLGNVYRKRDQIAYALYHFDEAIRIKPDFGKTYYHRGLLKQGCALPLEAVADLRKAVVLLPERDDAHSSLLFAMQGAAEISQADNYRQACEWSRCHESNAESSAFVNSPDSERRLRIGIVSSDLRNHPIGIFTESIFKQFNTFKIELFCYANHIDNDDLSLRIQRHVSHWENIFDKSDEWVADKIRNDQIDILVDLNGHTVHNRLKLFGLRPAPVQITWLGFFNTTGLKQMDYIICDQRLIHPEDEAYYTEKPLHMPDGYLCFSIPPFDIEVGQLPVLKNDYVTFGCFNYLSKVNRQVVALWAKIMHQVPESRLLLQSPPLSDEMVAQQFTDWFAEEGVASSRLTFHGRMNRENTLRNYYNVDIALDPFPYNGGTTTVEALWMGVPVITLTGDRFAGRVSHSILHAAGCTEWVAHSKEDYVQKAVSLASDIAALAQIRQHLRAKIEASPLCDAPRFAANLEQAFRSVWRDYCAARKA